MKRHELIFLVHSHDINSIEKEINRLESELERKFKEWENQKQTIKNYQEVVTKHFPDMHACSENLDEKLTYLNKLWKTNKKS